MEVNATTLNAVINALGALTFATVRQLPKEQQTAFANELADLARAAERRGDTTTETLLLDLHRAARIAPK